MSEEEDTIEEKEEEEKPEGETPQDTSSKIERAEKAVKDMKAENDRYEGLVQRAEKAKADDILGGTSEAGHEVKPKTDEEKTAEEANAMLEGSGVQV